MSDEQKKLTMSDSRPTYEAPRAMRLDGTGAVTGQTACVDGSGNTNWCNAGNGASGDGCQQNGNDARTVCMGTGTGALGGCLDLGSGFID